MVIKHVTLLLTAASAMLIGTSARALTIFEDDFDTHTIGDQLTAVLPPVGEWGSTFSITPTAHTVQANPLGAGLVLRSERPAGSTGFPTARTLTAPQANTILTLKWDAFRADLGSSFGNVRFYMAEPLASPNNALVGIHVDTQNLLYREAGSSVVSSVKSGWGGWERYEMVVTFGPDTGGGTIFANYDLFFERLDANNSEGVLARTQVADDIAVNTTGFTDGVGHMRMVWAMNPHADGGNSIVYWDNMSIDLSPALHPGDANSDGMVNLADLQILGDNWQSTTATWAEADFTGDGNVNLADLQIIGDNWGYGTGPDVSMDEALQLTGVAIPEPTALMMLMLAASAAIAVRSQRA